VAGPRPHDEMLSLVEAAFAALPEGDGRPARGAPDGTGTGRTIHDDTEQVHLVWGGRGLARDDDDREALDVVNHVLGGGLSSRLFDVVREQRGLVYGIASFATSYADCGAWTISAGTSPHHVDEVLELVAEQLDLLRRHGITAEELEIAHGALTGTFALGLEDTGSRMSRNGALLCMRGHITPVADQIQRWLDVDLDDTRRVLERVFDVEPIVVSVGPR
jgi:predicted Zn-dependent peptidase